MPRDILGRMRYVSLFSGIEAASVAWEPLGWEPVAFSEIEPFPCKLLAERFPDAPNLGDVSKIDWSPYVGSVDLVVGGSPCQAFSVAGKRRGLVDERGRLMLEYVRAVRDLRPRWLLWENVPGVLSQSNGDAFETLQRELADCGYSLAWRTLDAQFFGVAQRRRRVFLVGHLGEGAHPAAVLFERESLRWDAASSRGKRQALASADGGGARGCRRAGSAWSILGNVFDRRSTQNGSGVSDDISPTLNTVDRHVVAFSAGQSCKAGSTGAQVEVSPTLRAGSSGTNQVPTVLFARDAQFGAGWRWPWIVRRLMPVECERLQGFPDGWTDLGGTPDTPRYKALGNSMAVPVMRWIGERIAMVDAMEEV